MIDDRTMTQLRCAAASAYAAPGITVRLVAGETLIAHVAPRSHPLRTAAPSLSSCQFRTAVVRAFSMHQSGWRIGARDLHVGKRLDVELVDIDGDRAAPGGIIRLPLADRLIHLCALPVAAERCREVLGSDPLIGCCGDSELETTILHIESALDASDVADDVQLLGGAVARCAVADIDSELDDLLDHRTYL